MKFSIRFADQVVGVLVILGLAILVAVVFLLGSSQRWFARDFQYITYFNSAAGLSPNMAVQYKGFTMGRVKKIQLTDADTVEVIFTIFEEYNHRVKEGSIVEVNVSPIGLGSSFVFHPGKGVLLQERASKDPQEWPVIPEINSARAREYIAMGLASKPESSDSISNIINQVNMLLETINVALAGSNGAESLALGKILINIVEVTASLTNLVQSISDQINPILANIETISDDLSVQITPILANLEMITDDLSVQINPILANVETITGDLSGQLNPILTNVETLVGDLSVQINPILANVETLTGDLSTQINPILANVETITGDLSVQLNPILANVETLTGDLSTQINPILANVETLTDQLAEPSGTVMSILDSEGPVYSELLELLNSVTGILSNIDKVIAFVPGQLPQIALLLSNVQSALVEAEKVIISLTNNPLLKGGVPEIKETGPGAATPRNLGF